MSTAQNLTAFTYWPTPEPPNQENGIQTYTNSNFFQDGTKSKFFRHPMFFLNNITKQELSAEYEKTVTSEMQHRHFLAPLTAPDFHQNNETLVKPTEVLPGEATTKKEPPSKPSSKESSGKVRPYVCDDCGKTFLLKHHLTTHARTHTGIRPHVCVHCGKAFTHKHCLNTHLLLHSSERPYQCEECKKSFTLKHHLLTHARVHSREKPFVCTECGQAFPLKRHLITHSKFHAGERPFICEDCGESFAQKDHLVMHSRFHGFANSFVCSECGATFSRKFELVNHNKLHGKEPYTCPLCSKEFLQKRTLAAHIRLHSNQTPYTCSQCGESFQTAQELVAHSKSHASSPPSIPSKSLVCNECGCVFNTVEALALHIKLHTGDASLVTDLCTLTSSLQQSNFAININNSHHHPNNHISPVKQKNHICEHCNKGFSAKHGLYQHHKKHPSGTCALRSHVCEVCNKAFFQKNHLLLHQRQHMDPSEKNSSQRGAARQENHVNHMNGMNSNSSSQQNNAYEDKPGISSGSGSTEGIHYNNKKIQTEMVAANYQETRSLGEAYNTCHYEQCNDHNEREKMQAASSHDHRLDGRSQGNQPLLNGNIGGDNHEKSVRDMSSDEKIHCGVICSQRTLNHKE